MQVLVCLNPRLRQQRARKREDLLRATEARLRRIATAARKHKPGPENRDRTLKDLTRPVKPCREASRLGCDC